MSAEQEKLRGLADTYAADIAAETPGLVVIVVLARPDLIETPFAVSTNASVRGDAVKLLHQAKIAIGGS